MNTPTLQEAQAEVAYRQEECRKDAVRQDNRSAKEPVDPTPKSRSVIWDFLKGTGGTP